MDVLFSPIVDLYIDPPFSSFPEAVVYFVLDNDERLLADLTHPIGDSLCP